LIRSMGQYNALSKHACEAFNRLANGWTFSKRVCADAKAIHVKAIIVVSLFFSWAITRECIRCATDCSYAGKSH
jgi:hypothetical protein